MRARKEIRPASLLQKIRRSSCRHSAKVFADGIGRCSPLLWRILSKDGHPTLMKGHPMKLFAITFLITALITSLSAVAQENEPLTGGSPSDKKLTPGWARFEPTQSQIYWTAKAREKSDYRQSLNRYYDMMGFDYARPNLNVSLTTIVPVTRTRRWVWSPTYVNYSPFGY